MRGEWRSWHPAATRRRRPRVRRMQVQSAHFKQRASRALVDVRLQKNLQRLTDKFVVLRAKAIAELNDFEAIRDAAVERRDRALDNLDVWLEQFEREAVRRGASVLWAETP